MSNLHNKELKLMTIKWLRRKTDKHREQFNKHLCTQLPVAMVTEVSGASPLQSRARCINSALRMLIPRVRMLIPRVRRKDTAGATCRLVKLEIVNILKQIYQES